MVYHKLVKNNKGRGGGGDGKSRLKEKGGLLDGGAYLREGGLNRGFTVWVAQGKWILLT